MCKETEDPGVGGVTYDSAESLLAAVAGDGPVHK